MLPNSFKCKTTGAAELAVQILIRKLFNTGSSDFHVCVGKVVTPVGEKDHTWLENSRGTVLDPVGVCLFGENGNSYECMTKRQASNVIYEYLNSDLALYVGNTHERQQVEELLRDCPLKYLEKAGLA
ncbi:hypothetical protein [Vibrio owensii]|uniref:hypothetical protein n=1 Tax=Vibrio owensii TaxID=696485 RepID=UPI003CC67872